MRITLACLITITLVMMFRMPHSLVAFVIIYLITQEDTAATVLGSILGWVALTVGFWTALLALELSLDTPWLRICFFAALLLRRALHEACPDRRRRSDRPSAFPPPWP